MNKKCKICQKFLKISLHRKFCSWSCYEIYWKKYYLKKCIKRVKKLYPNGVRFRDGIKHQSGGYIHQLISEKEKIGSRKNWRKYIPLHRLLIEKKIERKLLPNEVVHHKDGNKENNDINNLQIFSSIGEHQKFHKNNTIGPTS